MMHVLPMKPKTIDESSSQRRIDPLGPRLSSGDSFNVLYMSISNHMRKLVRCSSCGCLCRKEENGTWPANMAEMHERIDQLEKENLELRLSSGKPTNLDEALTDLRLLGMKLRMGGNPWAMQLVREQIDAIVMKIASQW